MFREPFNPHKKMPPDKIEKLLKVGWQEHELKKREDEISRLLEKLDSLRLREFEAEKSNRFFSETDKKEIEKLEKELRDLRNSEK